jgi:dolichol-phosphate mannosyltransferase
MNSSHRQEADATSSPELAILVPVYNEMEHLPVLMDSLLSLPISKEIIIIDDGSTDGTTQLIRNEFDGKLPDVRVIYIPRNMGKGYCLRQAIPYVRAEYAIIQDGDMEYDPQDMLEILRIFKQSNAPVIYGSRFLNASPRMHWANRFINWLLAWMVRFLYRTPMTDEATCYKAFQTALLKSIPLTCHRFEFCPEITAKLLRKRIPIMEIPIRYHARSVAQGKKIRWTDGVIAIWTLIKYRIVRIE